MKYRIKIISLKVFLFFSTIQMIQAQLITSPEIAQFRWKQRLLVIVSYDIDFINHQLKIISNAENENGWKKRKLKWMVLSPDRYQIQGEPWVLNSKLYVEHNDGNLQGYCMLVGLDGSIKSKSKGMVAIQEVFDLIDTMPMRKSEMKHRPR